LANHVVHVHAGQLTRYPGDYQYYLDKTAAQRAAAESAAAAEVTEQPGERPLTKAREQKRLQAEQRQARYRQRKAQESIVNSLEAEIARLEQRQTELTVQLETPETYQTSGRAAEVTRELSSLVQRTKELTTEWEAAASILAELERTP
jgi:ATP-binding cassette subfamily F protein 3